MAIELNEGKTIFSGADLANIEPGHAAVREFTVKNTGTVDVYYRLYLENITGDLADSLVFSIYEGDKNAAQTGTPLYTGAASDFVADGSPFVDGKTLAPGETRTLTAVVKMGEGSGNAFQGDTVGFDLTAQCVQARNNPDKEFN